MTIQRTSVGLLAVFAVVMGINLVSAASRFTTAYDTYDRIYMELTDFTFVDLDSPVQTEFVIANPTRQTIDIIAIEMALSSGIHRVGGGENRVMDRLGPGDSGTYPVELRIFDRSFIERNVVGDVDWRVRGRVMVQLDPAIDPEWIPFTVRYLPS